MYNIALIIPIVRGFKFIYMIRIKELLCHCVFVLGKKWVFVYIQPTVKMCNPKYTWGYTF